MKRNGKRAEDARDHHATRVPQLVHGEAPQGTGLFAKGDHAEVPQAAKPPPQANVFTKEDRSEFP